jgi:hypothetical protein
VKNGEKMILKNKKDGGQWASFLFCFNKVKTLKPK